jgi:hypothetical protein
VDAAFEINSLNMETRNSMQGFTIRTEDGTIIRFHYYLEDAPFTTEAFERALPFSRYLFQARISGQEIWTDQGPGLDIIQENCSIFTAAGEIAIGPARPARNKIAGSMGIFYGEGRLLDGGNIFAKVIEEYLPALAALGDSIWRKGSRLLYFEKSEVTED